MEIPHYFSLSLSSSQIFDRFLRHAAPVWRHQLVSYFAKRNSEIVFSSKLVVPSLEKGKQNG